MSNTQGGFQPRTTPAERRAFFDELRQLNELKTQLAALQTTVADHETRIAALEP